MDELLNAAATNPALSAAQTSLDLINQQSNPSVAETDAASLADDFDTFLLLLTTQLQNQDPTEPLDTNEFTNQIVAFTGVEQSIKTNENLEALINLESSNALSSSLNYVGQFVDAEGSAGQLGQDGFANFAYELDVPANAVNVIITDGAGRAVFQGQGPTDDGKQRVVWDGVNSFTGQQEPPGTYFITISATNSSGEVMEDQFRTFTTGAVTGAEVIDGNVILNVAGTNVPVESVISIRQPVQVAPSAATVEPEEEDTTLVDDVLDAADDVVDEVAEVVEDVVDEVI